MTTDVVNHPPHYNNHPSGVECITITEHFNFLLGNAIKYIWRADDKGTPLQDLEKAKWYIERELGRRRLLEITEEHEEIPDFPALAEYTQAAGGLPNTRNRQSTADVLPSYDFYAWPAVQWDDQLPPLYAGESIDLDRPAPDFD